MMINDQNILLCFLKNTNKMPMVVVVVVAVAVAGGGGGCWWSEVMVVGGVGGLRRWYTKVSVCKQY